MGRIKVFFFLAVLFSVFCRVPLASAADDLLGLNNNVAIYESCKEAAQKDLNDEDFRKTLCYAHITGFVLGSFVMGDHLLTEDHVKSCPDKCLRIIKDISYRFCIPPGESVRSIASAYVRWVDQEKHAFREGMFGGLGSMALDVYRCDQVDKETQQ